MRWRRSSWLSVRSNDRSRLASYRSRRSDRGRFMTVLPVSLGSRVPDQETRMNFAGTEQRGQRAHSRSPVYIFSARSRDSGSQRTRCSLLCLPGFLACRLPTPSLCVPNRCIFKICAELAFPYGFERNLVSVMILAVKLDQIMDSLLILTVNENLPAQTRPLAIQHAKCGECRSYLPGG